MEHAHHGGVHVDAVAPLHGELHRRDVLAGGARAHALLRHGAVAGARDVEDRHADELGHVVVAEERDAALVRPHGRAAAVDEHGVGGAAEQREEIVVGALRRGRVAERRHDGRRRARGRRADDVRVRAQPHEAPVRPLEAQEAAVHGLARAHRAHRRQILRRDARAVRVRDAPRAPRLVAHGGVVDAEDRGGARVRRDDLARGVLHDEALVERLHDGAVVRFALAGLREALEAGGHGVPEEARADGEARPP